MNGYDFTPSPEREPETQSASSGGPPEPPPRPPKQTARNLLGPEGEIYVPGYIEVRELAEAMNLKPFRVVAELMELKVFKFPEDLINFETASKIAQKHNFHVEGFI